MTSNCPICFEDFSNDEVITCINNHIHACAYCLSMIKKDTCSICRVDLYPNYEEDIYRIDWDHFNEMIEEDSDFDEDGDIIETPSITLPRLR